MEIVVVIAIAALLVAGLVLSDRAAVKRREELAALARDLGFRFAPGEDDSHDEDADRP